jgi:diguanylate cyclase (GGDEF)-like protein/PAS domain S-box-containing protein
MPIRRGGRPYAVLSFYDQEPHAISGRVANLLAEMAAEIEHALERLELQAEARRAQEELGIAAIAFESRDAILVTNAPGTILRVNRAFSRTTGYAPEDVIGKDPAILRSGHHGPEFFENMSRELEENGHWQGEVWARRKSGEIYPTWLRKTSVRDSNGVATHYVDAFSDISEFKKTADTIAKLAYYDSLTGLPNRALMKDRLGQALAISGRSGSLGALLFIDLDNFKRVNDAFGHKEGDRMLQEAARRLQAALREKDTVARLGGDEFVVLLQDLGGQRERAAVHAKAIADKLLAVLAEPYEIANGDMQGSASIGVTLWRGSLKVDLDDLLKRADLAMYEAKKAGRNAVCFFDPVMQRAIEKRVSMEARLRLAISRDEFRLHLQKRVNGRGAPVGAEALIRWQDPEHGLVAPGEFIALAEETGLIIPIGRWVIDAACRRLKCWEQSGANRGLSLSVNVSPRQFAHSSFVRDIAAIISGAGIDPTLLELEITENLLLHDIDDTIRKIRALRDLGLSFALDDFGTGYSSLSYLQKLPLQSLKIDQSFVHKLGAEDDSEPIIRAIVQVGQSLGLTLVAEGVETERQWKCLARMACDQYQGYLFGRPVPVEAFEQDVASVTSD